MHCRRPLHVQIFGWSLAAYYHYYTPWNFLCSCQFRANPLVSHWEVVNRIRHCFEVLPIAYSHTSFPQGFLWCWTRHLIWMTDAPHHGMPVPVLVLTSWWSRRQLVVACSATDAEYCNLAQVIYLGCRTLLGEPPVLCTALTIFDNQSSIMQALNPILHAWSHEYWSLLSRKKF